MSTRRLVWLIGWGLTVIVAVMPFHAFLSVWLGSLTGHEAVIQTWKEFLLCLLAVAGIALIAIDSTVRDRFKNPLALGILAFAALAVIVTLVGRPLLEAVGFGIKTDLEFFLACFLAWLVGSRALVRRLATVILASGAIVVSFGLAQAYLLPADFLTHFGYGPETVVPYQTITAGISSLRFPSTLGGANQLGAYLILPLCLALALTLSRRSWWWLLLPTGLVVLFNTFSRSAWIGVIIALVITAYLVTARAQRVRLVVTALIAIIGIGVIGLGIARDNSLQYLILHSSVAAHDSVGSDFQHGESLANGTNAVLHTPLGHGLGTAGPATFHAGAVNIIEDYYLQIGYEVGVAGIILFAIIIFLLVRSLIVMGDPLATATAATIIGVSVAALVLPVWTDSSLALILWTFAGSLLGRAHEAEYV